MPMDEVQCESAATIRNLDNVEDWGEVEPGPTEMTTSNDELLVKEVQANRILWDITLWDYRNKVKRDAVWVEIGKRLKRAEKECQLRWKYLRERYNRELRKKNTKPNGSGRDSELEWELFTMLSFLSDVIKPRRSTLSYMQWADLESDGGDTPPVECILDVDGLSDGEIGLECPPPQSIQEIMEDVTSVYSNSPTPDQPQNKRRRDSDDDQVNTRIANEMASARKSMEAVTEILGKALRANVSNEPPHQRRLNALCTIISSRYTDLTDELRNEFEGIVLNAINMLHQRLHK